MNFNIDDLTIGQLKDIQKLLGKAGPQAEATPSHFLRVGARVFIRTITWHYTGEVQAISDKEIVLKDAAWIADSKRFYNFLKEGPAKDSEIEPFLDSVSINRDTVLDVTPWTHKLPREQQ